MRQQPPCILCILTSYHKTTIWYAFINSIKRVIMLQKMYNISILYPCMIQELKQIHSYIHIVVEISLTIIEIYKIKKIQLFCRRNVKRLWFTFKSCWFGKQFPSYGTYVTRSGPKPLLNHHIDESDVLIKQK